MRGVGQPGDGVAGKPAVQCGAQPAHVAPLADQGLGAGGDLGRTERLGHEIAGAQLRCLALHAFVVFVAGDDGEGRGQTPVRYRDAGVHRSGFNGSDLPNGIYIIALEADGVVSRVKVIKTR